MSSLFFFFSSRAGDSDILGNPYWIGEFEGLVVGSSSTQSLRGYVVGERRFCFVFFAFLAFIFLSAYGKALTLGLGDP